MACRRIQGELTRYRNPLNVGVPCEIESSPRKDYILPRLGLILAGILVHVQIVTLQVHEVGLTSTTLPNFHVVEMIDAIKMASDLRQMHLTATPTSQLVLQIVHDAVLVLWTVNLFLLWFFC